MARTTDVGRRIVAAARELFAERGYQGTTTRAIAERAGVNEVTVFRRFTNKAGVLRAIADELAQLAAGVVVSTGTAGSPHTPEQVRARLTELARLEVSSAVENGGLAIRLALEARAVPEVAEIVGAGSAANSAGLVEYLAGCQQGGTVRADLPPDLLAETFFAVTSSLIMGRLLMGAPAPDEGAVDALVAQLIEIFWSGVTPQRTQGRARS